MAFEKLFDNPLYGNHSPLVLGWTDDQLKPLVDRLAPFLPDNLTDQMQLATASCARSIVAEKKLTDRAVHYARRKDAYRVPQLGPLRIGVVAASTSSLRSPSTITDALSSLVSRSVLPVHGPG